MGNSKLGFKCHSYQNLGCGAGAVVHADHPLHACMLPKSLGPAVGTSHKGVDIFLQFTWLGYSSG